MDLVSATGTSGTTSHAEPPDAQPAIPLARGGDGDPSVAPPSATETTRTLCARAYRRPDRVEDLRREIGARWDRIRGHLTWQSLLRLLKRALRSVFAKKRPNGAAKSQKSRTADRGTDGGSRETGKQSFLLGYAYARWVRDWAQSGRPVSSPGADFGLISDACRKALLLRRFRVMTQTSAVLLGGALSLLVAPEAGFATVVLGVWLSYYVDRVLARAGVRRYTLGEIEHRSRDSDGRIVSYAKELRAGTAPKYHFRGAGKVWFESQVSIEVTPAEEGAVHVQGPPVDLGRHDRTFADFTEDDLYVRIQAALEGARDPRPDFLPANQLETFCVAAISEEKWGALGEAEWKSLVSLAQYGGARHGTGSSPHTARRFLCARRVSWEGELVTSTFVNVAYEDHFLRVVVRPHVLHPVSEDYGERGALPDGSGWRWHARAALHSALDIGFALKRGPGPESGLEGGSLREAVAQEYVEDMLQWDDVRRYIGMTQRRVYTAVDDFLVSNGVDTGAYRQQTTVIYNSGVINTGSIGGDVDNQAGSAGPDGSQ
ncbi:hypothetical protein [Streptomyces tanashiensis]|uniref:hypothetical protein n=1 Tax=Streptomyces tanashiensis TaxID=67367 RepID=UPI0034322D83